MNALSLRREWWLLLLLLGLGTPAGRAQTAVASGSSSAVSSGGSNRFIFFTQAQRVVRLDTATGTFAFLNTVERVWNPLVIPTRNPRDGNENVQNFNLLSTLSNNLLRRLCDPSLPPSSFRFVSVPAGGGDTPVPAGSTPPWVAGGSGSERLLRLDTGSGEFAVLDLQGAAFVRIQIPNKEPRSDINLGNVRTLGGMKF